MGYIIQACLNKPDEAILGYPVTYPSDSNRKSNRPDETSYYSDNSPSIDFVLARYNLNTEGLEINSFDFAVGEKIQNKLTKDKKKKME